MKTIFKITIFILLPFCVQASGGDIVKIRELYYKASTNKKDSETFSEKMKTISGIDASLVNGYTGMSYMIKANHSYNPYNKLSFFMKGKDLLDNAITSDAQNVELRFLRYCVQTNAPGFLGYSGKIAEDKKVILLNYHKLKDEDLKKRINEYMQNSKNCSKEEKALLLKNAGNH